MRNGGVQQNYWQLITAIHAYGSPKFMNEALGNVFSHVAIKENFSNSNDFLKSIVNVLQAIIK